MSAEYQKKQAALIAETIAKMDIVITTALIPGRPAPRLITKEMVESMKPGSVIVDLAVENGGNCELSQPGQVVEHNGVKIVGHLNVPGRLAADASALYARNIYNFIELLVDKESKQLAVDWEDKIVADTCIIRDGKIVHPGLAPKAETPEPAAPAEPAQPEGDTSSDGQGG
jgi:H+-translocating NAD(P) transhydrogenase subunit alpha